MSQFCAGPPVCNNRSGSYQIRLPILYFQTANAGYLRGSAPAQCAARARQSHRLSEYSYHTWTAHPWKCSRLSKDRGAMYRAVPTTPGAWARLKYDAGLTEGVLPGRTWCDGFACFCSPSSLSSVLKDRIDCHRPAQASWCPGLGSRRTGRSRGPGGSRSRAGVASAGE